MAASIVQTLTPSQIQAVAAQAAQIGSSNTLTIPSSKFVFAAFFDGTNNNRDNLKVSGDKQSTSVAVLEEMVRLGGASNIQSLYYPGPGTPGTIPGSSFIPSAFTAQIRATAEQAYKNFAEQARDWLDANPTETWGQVLSLAAKGKTRPHVIHHPPWGRPPCRPATRPR